MGMVACLLMTGSLVLNSTGVIWKSQNASESSITMTETHNYCIASDLPNLGMPDSDFPIQ